MGYSARGIRLADSGRLDEARAAFERSLAIDSSVSATHNLLGGVYWELGRYDRAIAEFQLAQVIAPSNTNARMSLGKVFEWQGEPEKALMVYERLVRDYPRHSPSLTWSALLLDGAGRLSEAAERYARVPTVDPGDDAVRSALGTVLLRLQRWRDAERTFSLLAARHPESPEVWFNLGGGPRRTRPRRARARSLSPRRRVGGRRAGPVLSHGSDPRASGRVGGGLHRVRARVGPRSGSPSISGGLCVARRWVLAGLVGCLPLIALLDANSLRGPLQYGDRRVLARDPAHQEARLAVERPFKAFPGQGGPPSGAPL